VGAVGAETQDRAPHGSEGKKSKRVLLVKSIIERRGAPANRQEKRERKRQRNFRTQRGSAHGSLARLVAAVDVRKIVGKTSGKARGSEKKKSKIAGEGEGGTGKSCWRFHHKRKGEDPL